MMSRETRTVLIVDGSPTMLYYHGILLMRLDYSVLTAANPEEALSIFDRTVPSLILTAAYFSIMSGTDFIRKIKVSDRTKHIPIIVLTAASDDRIRASCMEMGCFAYLNKPVDPRELFRAVQKATEPIPRENIRLNRELKVTVGGNGPASETARSAFTKTISEGGLYVQACAPAPRDARIPLTLFVNGREIRAEGMVLYCTDQNNGFLKEPGMAMKFTRLRDDDREYLRTFIHDQLTYDIVVAD